MLMPVVPVVHFVALCLAARALLRPGVLTTQRHAPWRYVGSMGSMILIYVGVMLAVPNTIWFHFEGLSRAVIVSSVVAATSHIYWLIRA
jgi:hypothetical protein